MLEDRFGDDEAPSIRPFADFSEEGEFNLATWIETGYWEYMDHEFSQGVDPDNPPTVIHDDELPRDFDLTIYGVLPVTEWPHRK